MAVATERVDAADGQRFTVGVEHISFAETRCPPLGENSIPYRLKPHQTDEAEILRQMGVSIIHADYNFLEKIIRKVRNPGEGLANLLRTTNH